MIKVDLSEQALQAINLALSTAVPGRPIFLFGSRVTGLARPDSDLDLLIGGAARLTREEIRAIEESLEDLCLPYEVDVIDMQDAKGMFLKRVQSEWVPLSEAQAGQASAVAA